MPQESAAPKTEGTRRLLLVSYLFPPCGGVGVQRVISFAKYLPEHGFRVSVLTARNAATSVYDPGLLRHIRPGTAVHRVFTPEPPFRLRDWIWRGLAGGREPAAAAGGAPTAGLKHHLGRLLSAVMFPDPQVVWAPFALRRALRIVRRERIDTVLASAPPYSVLRIGIGLKKRFPGLKLVSDFRDEWLEHYLPLDPSASPEKQQRAAEMEREVVERSDYVLTVTEPWRQRIRERYPGQPEGKFLSIPNGYDPELFAGFQARPHQGEPGVVITYVGTVYNNDTYSPAAYLEALGRLPEEVRSKIQTRFIGRVAPHAVSCFEGACGNVRRLGFLPQETVLRYMEETDYLLLIFGSSTGHSGKLLEYLAAGKPILALTPPDGEIARLLRQTRAGWCADHQDPQAIANLLRAGCERALPGQEAGWQPDWDVIRSYARPAIAAELARALRQTCPG